MILVTGMTKQEKIDWLSEIVAKPDCISEMKNLLSGFGDSYINRIYNSVNEIVNGESNETPE
jgi:hypothetical protein